MTRSRGPIGLPRTLAALALVGVLGGCALPGGTEPFADLTVAALLTGGGVAQLADLKAGGREIEVPRGPQRSAFLMLNAFGQKTDRLAVGIKAGAAFETRLRAWEAPLRLHPPAPRYRVAEVPRPYQVGDVEKFWVIADLEDGVSTEIQVPAKAAYVGPHCYIFVDSQIPDGLVDSRVAQMGQTFDQQIFPTDTRLFGEPLATGVNGDPHVTLLISPVVGNYGKDSTIGYFTVRDLLQPGSTTSNAVLKHSNQRLMLYVSPFVVAKGLPADYLGTIAHEFQHLINASQKLSRHASSPRTEELWLDEALSMYAMEANGYGLGGSSSVVYSHVAAFLADPGSFSLIDWEGNPQQSGYGAGYLFASYLADRFGEGLLRDLVNSPDVGIANLNRHLGAHTTTFRQVFDDWTAANLLDDTGLSSDPRYNYRNINLLGVYGPRRLRGVHLDAVQVPNVGSVGFRPFSAHYFYLPPGDGASLKFSLRGGLSQDFGGLVITP